MIRYLFVLFFFIQLVEAKEYPKLFSQLGTPLYRCIIPLSHCSEIDDISLDINKYIKEANITLQNGLRVDESDNEQKRKEYLRKLRKLQKQYDYLLHLFHKNINQAINEKNYKMFFRLTNYEFDGLLNNKNLHNKAILFYKNHKSKRKITLLEHKINSEKMMIESEQEFYVPPEKSTYNPNLKNRYSKKSVVIKTKQIKNKIYISIENKNIYDVTVKVNAKYKNIVEVGIPRQKVIVVKAKSTLKYTTLLLGEGKTDYKYQYSWMIGSKDALHDDTYIYRLPYAKGSSHHVSQGFNGRKTHKGRSKYAVDFVMPVGTKVYAARDGVVVRTQSNSNRGGYDKKFASWGNFINIMHNDGSFAMYYHLKKNGVIVKLGQRIKRGEHIGYSGNTGYTSGPHLHFTVYTTVSATSRQSVPFIFTSKNGLVYKPLVGAKYTAIVN